jgi:hypothetical protein
MAKANDSRDAGDVVVEQPAPVDTPVAVVAPAATTDFPLSLDEACARISQGDKRVEMIGAFHHAERCAGRLKDTETAYRARYTAFCNAPA